MSTSLGVAVFCLGVIAFGLSRILDALRDIAAAIRGHPRADERGAQAVVIDIDPFGDLGRAIDAAVVLAVDPGRDEGIAYTLYAGGALLAPDRDFEAIHERAIAFEHARICALLTWPYRMPHIAGDE